jgi:hypothetical protein
MSGKIHVAWIEQGLFTERMAHHSHLQIIDLLFPARLCGREPKNERWARLGREHNFCLFADGR